MANEPIVERDYVDNFSVKEYVTDGLMGKYFEDIDVNLRNVGMFGYTTEIVTNTSEDAFNTGSVLFRECFPNRAQLAESIYSHAAIFQLDDVFSSAASCKFLLVLEEDAILKNMENSNDFSNHYTGTYKISNNKSMFYFCIDKNTTIYVKETPFTLDYDIIMVIAKRETEKGSDYLYTARYVFEDYKNSISDLEDPYVKIRRSSDGYIALEVQTHQCTRNVIEESILTNNEINYPIIDIPYTGKLAGFDVLYQAPTDTGTKQMKTLISYSQPLKVPFCYYQLIDTNKIRITFNTKDTYFMPDFNANLKVVLYITDGAAGNFDVYNGIDISCVPNTEVYTYANNYLVGAQPVGSSLYGKDEKDIDTLQALAVEGYRTALALTTDNDLQEFFNNYKHRYGDIDILFIKKRDDVYERVFSAFGIIRSTEEIYKTNTLNLLLNIFDMKNPEKDVFILEPGTLFTANNTSGYAEFLRDSVKNSKYLEDYDNAVINGDIPYIEDISPDDIPVYLNRPASFAEYKSRNNLDDKLKIWDLTEEDITKYDDPSNKKFLLLNPFLIKFTKNPNLVSTYMTYIDNAVSLDFTNQNSDMYLQFTMYTFYMSRGFSKEGKYDIYVNLAPSMTVNADHDVIAIDGVSDEGETIYHLNDRFSLENNDLRVFMVVTDGQYQLCYTELVPTYHDSTNNNFTFSATMYTDDHITSGGKLRILPKTIYRNKDTGRYYKVHDDDATLCDLYDSSDNLLTANVLWDDVKELLDETDSRWYKYQNTVNMFVYDDILVPLDGVVIKIYTLYNHNFSESGGGLINLTVDQTNNIFSRYDSTLENYAWTNEYSTISEPVTFIKSLSSVRTYLDFLDYTEAVEENGEVIFTHNIMDAEMKSIPFIRASTTLDEDKIDYFFDVFYENYKFLENIIDTRLRNATSVDFKFYNTYGRSRDFIIGENNEVLDSVNLRISFDMWFLQGTDLLVAIPEVKKFIKAQIETVNDKGMNNLFISNLMRKIEQNFSYVDHIRFKQINYYNTDYQAVKNYVTDLNDLTVSERRWYVPELLVCDLDDIIITDYYVQ